MKFVTQTTDQRKLEINWPAIEAYVSRWRPGTQLEIEIKRIEKTDSDPLRKYYFSTVLPILCDTLGYDPEDYDDVHDHLKATFFRIKPDARGIYPKKKLPSVFSKKSEQGISIKMKFIEWVCRKTAEHGGYVPAPNERPNNG